MQRFQSPRGFSELSGHPNDKGLKYFSFEVMNICILSFSELREGKSAAEVKLFSKSCSVS